ncbi:MAG: peptidylprolyl isomerase [Candidatus Competibacter sp.]|nr:peptidylprolyl isomerase [Candidatus Competibacter sp.]
MKKLLYSAMLCLLAAAGPVSGSAQLVFGPGPEAPGSALDAIVAVVNDDVITRRELNEGMASVERQLRQRKTPIPPRPVVERQVLERMILARLQARAAERNGITVDDATLNAAIETLARNNKMTLTQMRQTVEKDGISYAKFRDDVRREIMGARLRQKLVDSQLQVSEQDVESLQTQMASQGGFGLNAEETAGGNGGGARQFHIAHILIALPESPSAQQIEAARRRAGEVLARLRKGTDFRELAISESGGPQALEGGDLGWRGLEQLPTVFAPVVPKLRPGQFSEPLRSPSGFHIVKLLDVRGGGEAPVRARPASSTNPPGLITETRARHILLHASPQVSDDDTRRRLEQLSERIRGGEDFATLAQANSDDATSGARGGDLGWVAPGMVVPQFEQAMNALQPNQISAPFKTPFGWHIVQVLERRQARPSPQMERARAREALLRRRSDEDWELLLRRLRNEAYVEIRLDPAAAPATSEPVTENP